MIIVAVVTTAAKIEIGTFDAFTKTKNLGILKYGACTLSAITVDCNSS